jgi:hypothetical protein
MSCAFRHARPRAGHPRLDGISKSKGVDGRDKPGHDETLDRHNMTLDTTKFASRPKIV